MNSQRILQAHCQRSNQSFVRELTKPTLTEGKRKHGHTTLVTVAQVLQYIKKGKKKTDFKSL